MCTRNGSRRDLLYQGARRLSTLSCSDQRRKVGTLPYGFILNMYCTEVGTFYPFFFFLLTLVWYFSTMLILSLVRLVMSMYRLCEKILWLTTTDQDRVNVPLMGINSFVVKSVYIPTFFSRYATIT